MIHPRTSGFRIRDVYIILERDSAKGRCLEMSDNFCVMHLKYLNCVPLYIVDSSFVI